MLHPPSSSLGITLYGSGQAKRLIEHRQQANKLFTTHEVYNTEMDARESRNKKELIKTEITYKTDADAKVKRNYQSKEITTKKTDGTKYSNGSDTLTIFTQPLISSS